MGSWLGYTIYPADNVLLENLRGRLTEALDDTVMDVYHHDDPEWVTPWIIEEYDAVGARVSTSPNRIYDGYRVVNTYTVEWATLRDAVVEWLERCSNSIAVVFIVTLHDTSDEGVLCGYRSEGGRLREVRSEDASYRHDGKKGSFPESGARLHPHDHNEHETDYNIDYLMEFEEEFGYRPVTFYR